MVHLDAGGAPGGFTRCISGGTTWSPPWGTTLGAPWGTTRGAPEGTLVLLGDPLETPKVPPGTWLPKAGGGHITSQAVSYILL